MMAIRMVTLRGETTVRYNNTRLHCNSRGTLPGMDERPLGRPRDRDIDARILEVARHHLAAHGYVAMSVAAVADDAGTTRQALYRRWPSKAELATAAIAAISKAAERPPTDDPFADLVRELAA